MRGLIQRLAPNIHYWNDSTFFPVERLWEDVGGRGQVAESYNTAQLRMIVCTDQLV